MTPRETDVLNQLAEGLSNQEIAERLTITVNTAKWYLRQIYSKLGAQRRTEAVMIAREIGLLDNNNEKSADPSPIHNLPHPATPFIGRSKEMTDIEKLLSQSDIRLITVTGTGGIGKTRLALEVAWQHIELYEDGVYFVPLAALQKSGEIFQIIGSTLELRFHSTKDAREQVLDTLQYKDVLLVLDNFEHLLDEGAHIVRDLLSEAASLQILCTSRQKLNLRGEAVFSIRGLDYPGWQPGELSAYSAVQLFLQRANLADPQIKHSEQTIQKMAHICRLVEGMPLAIELLSNWLSSLSLSEISTQIERSLDILVAELHDLPQRQQSIRAVFQHSWELLNENEQNALSLLTVFQDGFTLEAAQSVTNASLNIIAGLSSRSLIRRDRQSNRYDMHPLVQKFVQEKLISCDADEKAYERHAIYFSRFLVDQLPLLKGGGQTEAMTAIRSEYGNCQTAWSWAVRQQQAPIVDKMIDAFYLFLQFQTWDRVAEKLFQQARDRWPAASPDAPCIAGRVGVRFPSTSDSQERAVIFERGLTIVEKCNNLSEIAFCQRELGLQVGHKGSDDVETIQRGLNLLHTSLENYRVLDDRYYEAQLLDDIGWCYTRLHDREQRIRYSKESIDLRKEIGDVMGLGRAVSGYLNLIVHDDPDQADQLVAETYDIGFQSDNRYLMAESRLLQGIHPMMFLGELERAQPMLEDAVHIAKQINFEYGRRNGQLTLATIACIYDDDAEHAAQLIHAALPDEQTINVEIAYFLYGTMAYLAYSTLISDYRLLATKLGPVWKLPRNQEPTPDTLWLLPFAALLLAQDGDEAHAVRLLSLAAGHKMTMGFVKRLLKWSPVMDLQASLRRNLGDEGFDKLWVEGKTLDLKMAVKELAELLNTNDGI